MGRSCARWPACVRSTPPSWRPPASWEAGWRASPLTQAPSRAGGGLAVSPGSRSSALADRVSAPARLRIRLATMRTRRRRRFMPVERGPTRAWRGAPAFGAAWRGVRSGRIGSPPRCHAWQRHGGYRGRPLSSGSLVGDGSVGAGGPAGLGGLATRQRDSHQVPAQSVKLSGGPSHPEKLAPRQRHWIVAARSARVHRCYPCIVARPVGTAR